MKTRWYSQYTYPAQSGEGLVASQLFCFLNVFFSFIQYGARPVRPQSHWLYGEDKAAVRPLN